MRNPACDPHRSLQALNRRGVAVLATTMVVGACSPAGQGGPDATELSAWGVDSLLQARVVENVTACAVDADCFLRLEFADTILVARYGTGERPAPPCPISAGVSDAAWSLAADDLIQVRLHDCGAEGYFIEEIAR